MRFRLGHPDYPAFDFYITTPNEEVRREVNRLGPISIIAAAYDWPRNEFAFHGWVDQLNRIVWTRDADQFASCFLLLDDNSAELVKALVNLQFIAAGQPSPSSLTTVTTDLGAATGVLRAAEDGDELSSLHTDNDLQAAIVNASAGALTALAEGFSAASLAKIEADFATTSASLSALSITTESSEAPRPYLILRAMLAPAEAARAAEIYAPAGMTADDVSDTEETELMAWKLYPLPPVRLPDPDGSDPFPGLWLLPLVDLRYFWRLGPIGSDRGEGSSSSGDTVDPASSFPVSDVNPREEADWMPPLVTYPDDIDPPDNFVPILGNGTNPIIASVDSRGWAADMQALMQNWRVTCHDIRTEWNNPDSPHSEFTGIVCEYPDDPEATASYHLDAIRLASVTGNLIDGGLTDTEMIRALVPRKIRVLFRIVNQSSTYEVDVYPTVDDPQSVDDLDIDTDGPSAAEILHLPKAVLGVICNQENPDDDTKNDLYTAAKQWVLLYYLWRRKQCYFKFPGIAPVIPNGYGGLVTWDFSTDEFFTTYVAADAVAGTNEAGFGEGDSTNTESGETPDNTAFVLVTSDFPIEERYPVVRMNQVGLPQEWTDLEPAWAFNVFDDFGLVAGQKYLCHRNVDLYLGLNQWATRDCCLADDSSSTPEDDTDCGRGCCPNPLPTIDITIFGDNHCNPCLPMTVTLHCDGAFGHWSGIGTCTVGGCTVIITAILQCISCADPPLHDDCPVDCAGNEPYYFCLNWSIRCIGTCSPGTITGHKSWPASQVTCNPFSLPLIGVPMCGCTTYWCIGTCDDEDLINACDFGLTGTFTGPSGTVKVPLILYGVIKWCLFPHSDPLTCHDCFMVPDTVFFFFWNQVAQRWESGGNTAEGAGGCKWNFFGLTVTPIDAGMGVTSMSCTSVWSITGGADCHNPQGLTTSTSNVQTESLSDASMLKCPCTRTYPGNPLSVHYYILPVGASDVECSFAAYLFC